MKFRAPLTMLDLSDARRAAIAQRAPAEPMKTRAAAAHQQESQDMRDGYRRISGSTNRDLTPLAQDRMIELAWYIYDQNLFAKRMVGWMTEFVVGEGIKPKAVEPKVQEVIDRFWKDPVNRMKLNLESHTRELSIFGEQLLTPHVNQFNGHVRLGSIDPYNVDQVVWGSFTKDADDIALPLTVKLKSQTGKPGRELKVINLVDDPANPEMGFRAGEVFYFAVNKAKRGTRGRSDLFAAADYIDGYDQLLFSALERFDVATRVFEDVTLEGYSEEECRAWLNKPENRTPPKPLSKRAHNEKTTYQLISPNLGAVELEGAGAKIFRNFILGGMGFPNFWFAEGGETNLATAVEQGTPTFKMLSSRQQYVIWMITEILEFVIDRAQLAGTLSDDVDRTFSLEAPELSVRDATKITGALQQVTFSLQAAVADGMLSIETARQIFAFMVSQIGVPVDAEEEARRIAANPRPENADFEDKPFPDARRDAAGDKVPVGKVDDKKNPSREDTREE